MRKWIALNQLFALLSVALWVTFTLFWPILRAQSDPQQAVLQEEREDYFKKWLDEDVRYIISAEEKGVFEGLTTSEEKEHFIEQFWFRRDPDPISSINEFKAEHYRRIAYANERFSSGFAGWLTDRGRVYIIHGPPAEIEAHPSGGTYRRPSYEGGGSTSTFPFEIWRYRHLEGVGQDVELEFVDPSFSGEYRLATRPEEKDALLRVPGAGLTLAEELGLASKAERPFFSPGNREHYPLMTQRMKDNPFVRYETYAKVQQPKPIKYRDLKASVKVNFSFDNLAFRTRQDYIRLNDRQVLVPLTLALNNKDLTFREEKGVHVARVAVYGLITSITNRVVQEFDDDLITSFRAENLTQGLLKVSLYQKVLPLNGKMRYKLELVVKDLNSGRTGVLNQAIIPPAYSQEKLTLSSLILSDYIRPLGEIPTDDPMFVIGDVWVRPSLTNRFLLANPLGVYLQVYNASLDQSSRLPSLEIRYSIWRDGSHVREATDTSLNSVQFSSGRRIVLVKPLPIDDLAPGKYRVKVTVRDRILDQAVSASEEFELTRLEGRASLR